MQCTQQRQKLGCISWSGRVLGSFGHVRGGVRGKSRKQSPMEGNKDDAQRLRPLNIAFSWRSSLGLSLSDLPTEFPDESLHAKITLQLRGTGKPSEARRLAPHYHRDVSALLTRVWSSQLDQKTFLAFSLLFLVSRSFQPCTEPVPKPLSPFPPSLFCQSRLAPPLLNYNNNLPTGVLLPACVQPLSTPPARDSSELLPDQLKAFSLDSSGVLLSQLLLISSSPGVQFALL